MEDEEIHELMEEASKNPVSVIKGSICKYTLEVYPTEMGHKIRIELKNQKGETVFEAITHDDY